MKKLLSLIAALGCLAVIVLGCSSGPMATRAALQSVPQEIPKESKTQPKELLLDQDSQSDKYGAVPFNHENHSIKMYSIDGKAVIACVECHHTDQPATALKAPLKTSERAEALTAKLLEAADAKPVKGCRACHLQAGDDSAPLPSVTYPDKPAATKLTNEVAFHMNCNVCHDKAITARPALKGKVSGTNDCLICHKPAA